jgi:nucleotide-binding universal stress UspA family protein
VLVGVDGSAGSLAAREAAHDNAARHGSPVEVVTAGERADTEWADRVSSWDDAHPVAALLGRSERADLVVVGSRGLQGLKALGSVSERVEHQASARCSPCTRPPDRRPGSPRTVRV